MSGCTYEHCEGCIADTLEDRQEPPGHACECECRNCLGAKYRAVWDLWTAAANAAAGPSLGDELILNRLRDDMAMHAMAALLRGEGTYAKTLALKAYNYADEMLKERGDERRLAALELLRQIGAGLDILKNYERTEDEYHEQLDSYRERWAEQIAEVLR